MGTDASRPWVIPQSTRMFWPRICTSRQEPVTQISPPKWFTLKEFIGLIGFIGLLSLLGYLSLLGLLNEFF
jgi:hypothetical protein